MALLLVQALGLPDRLSATFVAVVCISPTLYSGLRRGLEQLLASAVGGGLAFALSFFLPLWAALPIALYCVIFFSFRFGLARGYLVAAFAVLYVLLIPGAGAAEVLEARLASVALGLLSATLLNLLVSFASWRAVFHRRLSIAREQVAQSWQRLSEELSSGTAAQFSPFDEIFVLLRALRDELADASREAGARGRRGLLAQAATGVQALLEAAHYGRDLELLLERVKQPLPLTAASSMALTRFLRAGQAEEAEAQSAEPACVPRLEAAFDAVRKANTCLKPWQQGAVSGS